MGAAVVAIALGGAIGALSRFACVYFFQIILALRFPLGTLVVNCLGSFLIGLIMSLLMERVAFGAEQWRFFLVIGFLGSFTTFSSFAWETSVLYNNGYWLSALSNILLNNIASLVMVVFGMQLGRFIGGI